MWKIDDIQRIFAILFALFLSLAIYHLCKLECAHLHLLFILILKCLFGLIKYLFSGANLSLLSFKFIKPTFLIYYGFFAIISFFAVVFFILRRNFCRINHCVWLNNPFVVNVYIAYLQTRLTLLALP